MRFVTLLLTAGLAVCYAQPPFARGAGPGPDGAPVVEAVQTYLELTDAQLSGFQAIRETARTAAQPILEQIRAKTMALREAVESGNATAAGQLQVEIQTLRDQIERIQASARDQAGALLTAAQKTKLATLVAAADLLGEVRGAGALGLIQGPEAGPGFGLGRGGPGRGGPGRGPRN